MSHVIIQPDGWPRPSGYSNGVLTDGPTLHIAGLVGWDETETFQSDDFTDQVTQILKNICAVLEKAGGKPEHICRLTWYVVDKQQYLDNLKGIGQAWREIMGAVFPAMALIEIKGLVEEGALLEIETTAVLPRT